MAGFFARWRQSLKDAEAKRVELNRKFDTFVRETEPLAPTATKHPKATLYRHAWKRAAVIELIYQRLTEQTTETKAKAALYAQFQNLAATQYNLVAPIGPYGKAKLVIEAKAATKLYEEEFNRQIRPPATKVDNRPLACIYIGRCEQGRVYVGQTVGAPEMRWVQHRTGGTGPFKGGERYVEWRVIEGSLHPSKLDEREAYWIGVYDAVDSGYNDTRGNHSRAYEQGQAKRGQLLREQGQAG